MREEQAQTELEPLTAAMLASLVGGELVGDSEAHIRGVCHFLRPQTGKVCFVTSSDALDGDPTAVGAILIAPAMATDRLLGTAIFVANPRHAFALIVEKYFAPARIAAIAKSAKIDPSARIGEDVSIGEGCVIGPGVVIGIGTQLRHNVILGPSVQVGESCVIGSNTVIGEVGFGLAKDETGRNVRIPHIGSVVIGDDVEIGALSSIAAGTIEPTQIGHRSKIDDQVFIAHNCVLEEDVIVIACAEISGSVRIGARTWVGPNVSIRDRVTIPPDTLLGIGSTVVKTLTEAGVYIGSPARLLTPSPRGES